MFETLSDMPPDGLLALIKAFRSDSRPSKIDLGVGVFRDAEGRTPVMRAVKAAERHLVSSQASKSYLGPEGDAEYTRLIAQKLIGLPAGLAWAGIQTPGGTGAIRLGAELIAAARPGATVWLGTPTWPNHAPIFAAARLAVRTHPFASLRTQSVDLDGVLAALGEAAPGDVVLLHGCCHNPTGIDFDADQWKTVVETMRRRRLLPFVDLAYQGLGLGLAADAAPTLRILECFDEAVVAYSCDKNFGLYRDRVGALYVTAGDAATAARIDGNLGALARVNWSMPPDHGAAIVRTILEDAALEADWRAELVEMAARVNGNRAALASAHPALGFIARQRGMFSTIAMSRDTARALREKHAVYMADSGRINIAGMGPNDAGAIVAALAAEGVVAG